MTTISESAQAQAASRVALLGSVLAEQGERPIAGAQVELVGNGNMTTTDSSGVFALWDIVPGRYRLLVRALGFAPLDVPLVVPVDGLDALEILLPPTLGRVEVKAGGIPREAHLRGFDQRRRWGSGRFMDSTRLHAYGPMQWATQLTINTPFLQIVRFESPLGSGYTFAGRRRGAVSLRGDVRSECYPHIIVDNVVMYANGIGELPLDISFLTSGPPVVASEYYSASQVPAEFDKGGLAVCGAIVLWTQR